jgi:hypothetical protein
MTRENIIVAVHLVNLVCCVIAGATSQSCRHRQAGPFATPCVLPRYAVSLDRRHVGQMMSLTSAHITEDDYNFGFQEAMEPATQSLPSFQGLQQLGLT